MPSYNRILKANENLTRKSTRSEKPGKWIIIYPNKTLRFKRIKDALKELKISRTTFYKIYHNKVKKERNFKIEKKN